MGPSSDFPLGLISELPDPDDILDLIEKIKARVDYDESCSQIYDIFHKRVESLFRRQGFSPDEIPDLTQDVFHRVFKSIDTFRSEAQFGSWLSEIAGNVFRNEIRRKRAEKRDAREVSIDVPQDDDNDGGKIDPPASSLSALDGMIQQERQAAIRTVLASLPPKMRRCCEFRYVRGLKYQEIADLMNLSIETVKAHLHQGRKRIEEAVGKGAKPS